MPNRLVNEKSSYLLQHADNPVDWYSWGPEAFQRARAEEKPILVSIGYSACHWCHVMEHESFEDNETADLMNDRLICIKVDREERPDVDTIYMEAVQALTGQGGWPLNIFVTPDGRPFFGGTYFPPQPHHGLPSWQQVVESVSHAYREQREEVLQSAAAITQYVERSQNFARSEGSLTSEILTDAYSEAVRQFNWTDGGFGGAPKFPQPLGLEWLLRMSSRLREESAQRFVEITLRSMAHGGIYDHLGGGFHRYTVDRHWVVPHFEKMLYDNALLVRVYLHAFQITNDPLYKTVVEQTVEYLLRDMRSSPGGFYSSEDADSEGVEGKYYVWTPAELVSVLGADQARLMALHFGVTAQGNFEGASILTETRPIAKLAEETGATIPQLEEQLSRARRSVLEARYRRVPPGKDTKIIASWNGLAIRALAEAGAVLGRTDFTAAAESAATFLLRELRPKGRLVRSFNEGASDIPAFLEDYAFVTEGLITLYETTSEQQYLASAQELVREMIESCWDDDARFFYDSPPGAGELVVRPRSLYDNPIPSGNSAAAFALLRLEAITGDAAHSERIASAFLSVRDIVARAPLAFAHMLSALDFYLSTPLQIAIAGDPRWEDTQKMKQVVFDRYLPNAILAVGNGETSNLLMDRPSINGCATAYVCRHFACNSPVTDPEALAEQLDSQHA